LPAEQTQGYLNYNPVLKYTKNGDTYTLTSVTAQGTKEVSFKSGVAFDETVAGKKVNTTYTVDGDTITQVQKSDDGVLTITRTFSGNELVVCGGWATGCRATDSGFDSRTELLFV
ncbi:hypothetical protein SFRURICE_017375, partial [Spodoptera frugiperda]